MTEIGSNASRRRPRARRTGHVRPLGVRQVGRRSTDLAFRGRSPVTSPSSYAGVLVSPQGVARSGIATSTEERRPRSRPGRRAAGRGRSSAGRRASTRRRRGGACGPQPAPRNPRRRSRHVSRLEDCTLELEQASLDVEAARVAGQAPFAPTMRWHGRTIGIGLRFITVPTARAAFGRPTRVARAP